MHKVLAGAVAVGLGVAGCTAAAHLRVLQPPALTGPAAPVLEHAVPVRKPGLQLGVGIDLYTYPGQDFGRASAAEVAYLRALHANAVTVSFPFFVDGARGLRVFGRAATPTPAQLGVLARAAENAGLYVALRPLLANASLGMPRNTWRPRNPRAWFASYQRFLLPYARMAQRNRIPELYVGAEFQYFGTSPRWNGLDRAVRRVYRGTLAYANNGHKLLRGTGGRGVAVSADSYPDLEVPASATVGTLTRDWEAWDRVMPRGTVLSEVGIAGVLGAYRAPWMNKWPHPRLDPAVQARWLGAACHAAAAAHMGGIYFWAIGFGAGELATSLSRKNQGAWERGAGERAVAACYQQLRHG
jgi:hypothetical protein